MNYVLDGKNPVTIRSLFKRHGMFTGRWPKKLACPQCERNVYFYGKPGLIYYLFGFDIPAGTAIPTFKHYPDQASGCNLAKKEFNKIESDVGDKHNPAAFREVCLSPTNYERTQAVVYCVLGPRNNSEEKVQELLRQADKNRLWDYGFPSWATPYVLLLNSEIDYEFKPRRWGKKGNTFKVRFELRPEGGQLFLTMLFNSGRPVLGHAYPISETATDKCLERYRVQIEKERRYGMPLRQQNMFASLLNKGRQRQPASAAPS